MKRDRFSYVKIFNLPAKAPVNETKKRLTQAVFCEFHLTSSSVTI